MLIESACSVDRVEEALSTLLPMLPEIQYFRFNPGTRSGVFYCLHELVLELKIILEQLSFNIVDSLTFFR